MKILGLDTSTEACTVALGIGETIIERVELGGRHAEHILVMVDELLAQAGLKLAQLDAIAFGRGPGSFTGLRIATGVAQGLAFGAALPVVPVSSLAALAQGVDAGKILTAIDARMQQVYWGAFRRGAAGVVEPASEESVVDPAAVPLPEDEGWIGAGSGWDAYHTTLTARLGNRVDAWRRHRFPHARAVVELGRAGFAAGRAVPADEALPVYIRDEVAVKQVRP